MSDDFDKVFTLSMFAPIQLSWNPEQQELSVRGTMLAGAEEKPFQVQHHGEAAVQLLRAFWKLLDHVDEETLSTKKPSDLQ